MKSTLISRFPDQLRIAIEIARRSILQKAVNPIYNVVICGLEGAGIEGTIVKELVQGEATVPIELIKDYSLPAYVNENSLIICTSYSGYTEETLEAFIQAKVRKAHLICISSDGKLLELAKKRHFDTIKLPPGFSQRSGLGHSLTQLLWILEFHRICSPSLHLINSSAELLESNQSTIRLEANTIADLIFNKTPVIYSTLSNEGVSINLRQQLNENAKILCWQHVIPEMKLNEGGWSKHYPKSAVLIFRERIEYARNDLRLDFCKRNISKYSNTVIEIFPKGFAPLEKKLYWIHMADWIAWYVSRKLCVNASIKED
jgi:glucose/mannose-6-phosphate isomerase